MKIDWEDIRWETDDVGTSWATLADEEHNSLTLEYREGRIAFHTDGNPRFEVPTVLEITALCVVLSRNALGQVGRTDRARDTARSSGAHAATLVPEQRHAPLTHDNNIEPRVRR
jgi:hypothetical protein